MLENKVAVIYGGGGAIGGAVARAFAREGARLFLVGRTRQRVDAVAEEIEAAGGSVNAERVDALDERSVDQHLESVVGRAGRIDIVFNAIGISNTALQGVPLVDLQVERFVEPILTYTKAYFLTARLAARRMLRQRGGVIMSITATPSRSGVPLLGGFAPAQAAQEALTRGLSAELAAHGIRVVGLRADGMPETPTIKEVFGIHAMAAGMSWEQFHDLIAGKNHRRRLPTLAETADVAAFLASDRAGAMTGTVVNLSMGMLDD